MTNEVAPIDEPPNVLRVVDRKSSVWVNSPLVLKEKLAAVESEVACQPGLLELRPQRRFVDAAAPLGHAFDDEDLLDAAAGEPVVVEQALNRAHLRMLKADPQLPRAQLGRGKPGITLRCLNELLKKVLLPRFHHDAIIRSTRMSIMWLMILKTPSE